MRDSRINVWNNSEGAVTANGTTNGPTINLLEFYTGSYKEGAPGYGLGVEIIAKDISGNEFSLTYKWQVSDDGSTWVDHEEIFKSTTPVADADAGASGDTLKIPTRLHTPRQYARIVRVISGIVGNDASVTTKAWVSDGTTKFGYATQVRA